MQYFFFYSSMLEAGYQAGHLGC